VYFSKLSEVIFMQTVKVFIIIFSTVIFSLTGCIPSSRSGAIYSREQARQVQEVELGVLEAVRPVQIEGVQSGVGSIGGAIVGAIAGSEIGGGKGSAIASTIGTIAGGVLGSALEEGATRKQAFELTVRLDSGRIVSVVQEADVPFQQGERVRVLSSVDATRVSH
jgi:outer membrane lipoprotein SlyB